MSSNQQPTVARAPGVPEESSQPGILSTLSNEMVRLYKELFGRGPTKVRTHWAGPDILIVTLEETYTPAERNLRDLGEHERLRDLRLFFQYANVGEFCDPVERLTGRKVRAFISGVDTETDLATEVFVLHPEGYVGPSRSEAHSLSGRPSQDGQVVAARQSV